VDCRSRRHHDGAVHANQTGDAQVSDGTSERISLGEVVGIVEDLQGQLGHRQVGRVVRQDNPQDDAFNRSVFLGWGGRIA
jgi:hypothetical protein